MLHVAFYAEQLYYLPQYLPVMAALRAAGHRVTTLLRSDTGVSDAGEIEHVAGSAEAYARLRRLAPDWAVFGSFLDERETLAAATRSCLIYHGIGVKNVLFDPRLDRFDLRCVESERVHGELLARNPALTDRLALTGFAKLDPLFGAARAQPAPNAAAPTVLYAPTFYPSSLELMPKHLSSLVPGAHWLVKPHFFSWTIDKYAAQRKRLEAWSQEANVEVLGPEHYNLVPLMARSAVLVSDASSALFEFAALRRPVLWCRFQKVRWSYRGLFSWRLKQRIDPQAARYEEIASCVDRAEDVAPTLTGLLATPHVPTPAQEALVDYLIGPRDGQVSARIVGELERRAKD